MSKKTTEPQPRKRFPILLGDAERARYQAAADAAQRSLADWIRVTCDDAAARSVRGR